MQPVSEQAAETLVQLGGCLVRGTRWEPELKAGAEGGALLRLLKLHGLVPPPRCLGASALELREGGEAEWSRLSLLQAVRQACAHEQLRQLAAAFAASDVPLVFLKGAALLARRNEAMDWRAMADLDVLVPADRIRDARRTLETAGYRSLPNNSSEEYERIKMWQGATTPFLRPGSFTVDLHASIRHGRGRRATEESVWAAVEPVELDGSVAGCLSLAHAIIETAVHYIRHLESDFAPLKGLIDLGLLAGEVDDWEPVWHTAGEWGVRVEVATALAILREHWGIESPGVPVSRPLGAVSLAQGTDGVTGKAAALVPGLYLRRLELARALPNGKSRARFLARLVCPPAENLRFRYRVPEGRPLAPYYLLHPLVLAGRFVRGLGAAARARLVPTRAGR